MKSDRLKEILPSIRKTYSFIMDNKMSFESKFGTMKIVSFGYNGVVIDGRVLVSYRDICEWIDSLEEDAGNVPELSGM